MLNTSWHKGFLALLGVFAAAAVGCDVLESGGKDGGLPARGRDGGTVDGRERGGEGIRSGGAGGRAGGGGGAAGQGVGGDHGETAGGGSGDHGDTAGGGSGGASGAGDVNGQAGMGAAGRAGASGGAGRGGGAAGQAGAGGGSAGHGDDGMASGGQGGIGSNGAAGGGGARGGGGEQGDAAPSPAALRGQQWIGRWSGSLNFQVLEEDPMAPEPGTLIYVTKVLPLEMRIERYHEDGETGWAVLEGRVAIGHCLVSTQFSGQVFRGDELSQVTTPRVSLTAAGESSRGLMVSARLAGELAKGGGGITGLLSFASYDATPPCAGDNMQFRLEAVETIVAQ
jgi:hypothetical protein